MFTQTTQRFTDTLQGMRQMAAEMQRELETTRNELRRGILELPQETAESASQMRRVIVDQIEALAELNRIVARHGRGMDAAEPPRRAPEPAYAVAGGRAEPAHGGAADGIAAADGPPPRADITGIAPPPPPRRAEAPSLTPGQPDRRQRLAVGAAAPRLEARARRRRRRPAAAPHAGVARTRSPSTSRG